LVDILELLGEGKLPLYANSGEMLEHDSFTWEHLVPGEYGSTTLVDEDSNNQPVTAVRRETTHNTHLDVNGAMLDIQMEMDLNSMKTCKYLADYVSAAKDKLLAEGTTDDVAQELLDVKPILKDVKPAVCGDRLPTHMFTRLARQEPNPYGTLDYYFGGFHLVLNGYRDSGRSWEESHLGHFFRAWSTD
jgi:hypothetical protein